MAFGFLNINKPSNITAHDAVMQVRKVFGQKRVGHGGTLDPMATGVLPIGLGSACRLLPFLNQDKVYIAEILLGVKTTTDDIEGTILATCSTSLSKEKVAECLSSFVGNLMQIPPLYSAVHHQGQRLYKLARKGVNPENIPPRPVTVYSIEVLNLALPVVQVKVSCSAGTYIRSIARDLGINLEVGGCLKSLIRERAGSFTLQESIGLNELSELKISGKLGQAIVSPIKALNLASMELNRSQALQIKQGQPLPFSKEEISGNSPCLALCEGELVAILRSDNRGLLHPEVVIVDGN